MFKILLPLIIALLSTPAHATCQKSYVCGDSGEDCAYMDVCDKVTDVSSTNVRPIPSLPTTDIKPLPSLAIPPVGTTRCEYVQVNGKWRELCF